MTQHEDLTIINDLGFSKHQFVKAEDKSEGGSMTDSINRLRMTLQSPPRPLICNIVVIFVFTCVVMCILYRVLKALYKLFFNYVSFISYRFTVMMGRTCWEGTWSTGGTSTRWPPSSYTSRLSKRPSLCPCDANSVLWMYWLQRGSYTHRSCGPCKRDGNTGKAARAVLLLKTSGSRLYKRLLFWRCASVGGREAITPSVGCATV